MGDKIQANYTFNIISIGESAVGKTCIINAYAEQKVDKSNLSTIGVEFRNKKVDLDGVSVKLKICDTAGQERYRNLTLQYFRDAKGILLVYDITNPDSFENLRYWIEQIKNNTSSDEVSMVLLGNKSDQVNEREVSTEKGKEKAAEFGATFFETSAYQNNNINEAFQALIREMIAKAKKSKEATDKANQSKKKLEKNEQPKEQKKKCC